MAMVSLEQKLKGDLGKAAPIHDVVREQLSEEIKSREKAQQTMTEKIADMDKRLKDHFSNTLQSSDLQKLREDMLSELSGYTSKNHSRIEDYFMKHTGTTDNRLEFMK